MLNKYQAAVLQALTAMFGWLFFWPLTFLVPRKRCRFIVIGRDGGKFLDNSKHLFIGLQCVGQRGVKRQHQGAVESSPACVQEHDESDSSDVTFSRHDASFETREVVFLTDQPSVRFALKAAGCRTGPLSGMSGWWQLLRCGTVVVDSTDWSYRGRFTALRGARVVQLWHGVPLKRIELLVAKQIADNLSPLGRLAFWTYRALIGRHRRVDFLVSTSAFVAHEAMMSCFNAQQWPATGYPRNDVLLDENLRHHPLMLIGMDDQAGQAVREARSRGCRVLLYAPTFRKHFVDPFSSGALNLAALERFAEAHDLLILVKLHPLMRQPADCGMVGRNIVFVSPDSDIYPLMGDVDLLVTDYSSIYFDFLLLDRPIVYYCQDLNDYIKDDRGFIFDYDAMTPGPKVQTQTDMESVLTGILQGEDDWHERRERVRNLVFDYTDGSAVDRLMALLDDAR
jgi:CDP-glycerol glycerophosphotransferase